MVSFLSQDPTLQSITHAPQNFTKPGTPGRPIISNCNCPFELLASYLDQITTPLTGSWPSQFCQAHKLHDS